MKDNYWDGKERRSNFSDCKFVCNVLENKIDNLSNILNTHVEEKNTRLNDHELRIRFLEKSIWIGFGGLAMLQLILKFFIK